MTTKDLEERNCVELEKGERPYSDQECLEYEREYLPLHVFMNSRVGYQTPILKDRVCGAEAGDRRIEERETVGPGQVPGSTERDNRSKTGIENRDERPPVAILAQDAPEDLNNRDPKPAARHPEATGRDDANAGPKHVKGPSHPLSSDPGGKMLNQVGRL